MVSALGSPMVQAGLLALLSGVVLWVSRHVYRRAHSIHEDVSRSIRDRKRPRLRNVLYEIFWLPAILFGMIGVIRIGVAVLPGSVLVETAVFVLDRLGILVMVVLSVNVIRAVVRAAGQEEMIPEEKEG